jgi:hypothetical protein
VLTGSPGEQSGVFYEQHRLGLEGSGRPLLEERPKPA